MERDNFIIMVFCLVSEMYHLLCPQPVRRRGFAPALSDEEVITIDIAANISAIFTMKTSLTIFTPTIATFFQP